jgi:hypothetical protein
LCLNMKHMFYIVYYCLSTIMLYPNTWFLLVPSVTCFQARKLHCDHCCLAGSHLGPLDKPSCAMSVYSIFKRWAISSAMAWPFTCVPSYTFFCIVFATYFLDPTVCHFHAWILCPGKETQMLRMDRMDKQL